MVCEPESEISVRQETSSITPITTWGMMSTLVWEESSAKVKVPKHTKPVPGTSRGLSTVAAATIEAQAFEAS